MARFTTIIAMVADRATELVHAVEEDATNVTAVRIDDQPFETVSDRRRAAWADAERRRNVYTITDFDPLAPLLEAWAKRLGGDAHAMDSALALVDRRALPEYVFVDDTLEDDSIHWYLGLLRGFSVNRVVPVSPTPWAVINALGHLRSGPLFPTSAGVVAAALDYVPTGLAKGDDTPTGLITPA